MKIQDLPTINSLSNRRNAFMSAILSLELGHDITITVSKSINGNGAQIQLKMNEENMPELIKILQIEMYKTEAILKELGVTI